MVSRLSWRLSVSFGFEVGSKFGIRVPFDAPDNAFLAIELVKDALREVKGVVEYPQPYLDGV